MASAIKRKREITEDPVSVKASKRSRHSKRRSKQHSTASDANHQNTQDLQTNGATSRETLKAVPQLLPIKSISDDTLPNGQHYHSEGQNGNTEEAGTQQNDVGVIKVTEKISKRHRKRKLRNGTKKIGTTLENGDLDKSFRDQPASTILDTSSQSSSDRPSSPWRCSVPSAGRFINHKPLFVDNDKCVILAVSSALRVYSTSTSALVNSVPISSSDQRPSSVLAYAASAIDDQLVYVSATNGLLFKFDWKTGQCLGEWQESSNVTALYTSSHNFHGEAEDILIYVEQFLEGSRIIARDMPRGAETSEASKKVIYTSPLPIRNLEGDQSGTVVAHTEERLIVGAPNFKSSILESKYAWREAQVAEKIRCVDVRTYQQDKALKKSTNLAVDVILGNGVGAVIVYYDFLAGTHSGDDNRKASRSAKSGGRQLHWHRNSISTARWSADGNYIISGGNERTLVLWQLDTGRPQYLPHLPSGIENVMVSSAGTSYALKLADNSVIIISTLDLEARANITGIQADSWGLQTLATKNSSQDHSRDGLPFNSHLFLQTPSTVNPKTSHLLLAVSSGQITVNGSPYLQTFDCAANRSVNRQALARTNATIKLIGGDLSLIGEPTVYLVKCSPDGRWLATVDSWISPRTSSVLPDEKPSTSNRREIFLKFWKRDEKNQVWELVTRVDAPHNTWDSDHETGLVLDVAANPHQDEFATLGEDGIVKIWRPKIRTQDGLVIRPSNMDEGLWSWSCRKIIALNQPVDVDGSDIMSSASLAYSEDASTLSACYQHGGSRDPCLVHFVHTLNGDIRFSRIGLVRGLPLSMGFLDRYLIIISEDIIVWDVVDDCLRYGFRLPPHGKHNLLRSASTHLAIDHVNKTFAVALPVNKKISKANTFQPQAQIAVFSPEQPLPQFHSESPHPVTALHFNPSNRGYLAIDAAAEIRYITPTTAGLAVFSNALAVVPDESASSPALQNIYTRLELPDPDLATNEDGDLQILDRHGSVEDEDLRPTRRPDRGDEAADGPPIVRREQLEEIFDIGPAFALPSVDKLFTQIAELYIGQTKT